jgi:ABC-type transport system involved in cytochrome c biogenesis ATPase subunit
VSVLSGGEKSRVQLAILMTTPADLLILDEPTNHLDLQGIEFVEDFVVRYPGAASSSATTAASSTRSPTRSSRSPTASPTAGRATSRTTASSATWRC